ncbi:hypothetical protein IFR04_015761 [Cadophora malorum]|uniref:Uncharacterized protein n=1 Tax=Cadophora malorum TaxID=108018 RepID=A0A8H7W500_9HELO|nr:hypothetical protein IFR04_015761 [Cadophora malorum]
MCPARAIAAHAHQFRYASLKSNVEIAFVASLMITFIAVHSDMPERKDSIPLQLFDHVVRSSLAIFGTQEIKKLLEFEFAKDCRLATPQHDTQGSNSSSMTWTIKPQMQKP